MNVSKPRRTRRTHSEEFKQSLINACGEPGVTDRHNRATSDRHMGTSKNLVSRKSGL